MGLGLTGPVFHCQLQWRVSPSKSLKLLLPQFFQLQNGKISKTDPNDPVR